MAERTLKQASRLRAVGGCALLLASLLPACTLRFEDPSPVHPPVPQSFSPAAAFAGATLEIRGHYFSPNPYDNEIRFSGGSARAEQVLSGGRLRVVVPDGIESGPLSVVTAAGVGSTTDSFTFLGPGHPRQTGVTTVVPVHYSPAGLALLDGELLLSSAFFRSVVRAGGERFDLPGTPRGILVSDTAGGPRLFVAGRDRLWRHDPGCRARRRADCPPPAELELGGVDVYTLEELGSGLLRLVGPMTDPPPGEESTPPLVVLEVDKERLTQVGSRRLLRGLYSTWGACSSPDGRELLLTANRMLPDGSSQNGVALVELTEQPPGTPPAADRDQDYVWLPILPGSQLVWNSPAIHGDRAYVPMDGGAVAELDLAADPPAWSRFFSTGTFEIPQQLAIREVEGETLLVGIHYISALLFVMSLNGELKYNLPLEPMPSALLLHPTVPWAFVAHESANLVERVDYRTGRVTARYLFEPGLGDTSYAKEGSTFHLDPGGNGQLLVVARELRAVLSLDPSSLELKTVALLPQHLSPPCALAGAGPGQVWVLHDEQLGRLTLSENGGLAEEEILVDPLPSYGQMLLPAGEGKVIVGMTQAVALWEEGPGATLQPALEFPQGTLANLSFEPDGTVQVIWTETLLDGYVPVVGAWSLEQLAGRGPAKPDPLHRWTCFPEGCTALYGAQRLDETTLLFYRDPVRDAPQVLALEAGGRCRPPQPSSVLAWGPVGLTPDHRHLFWCDILLSDGVVRYARHEASGSVRDNSLLHLQGDIAGHVLCEPSGERCFVPLGGSNTIAVIE